MCVFEMWDGEGRGPRNGMKPKKKVEKRDLTVYSILIHTNATKKPTKTIPQYIYFSYHTKVWTRIAGDGKKSEENSSLERDKSICIYAIV